MKPTTLANKWIAEMQQSGLTKSQMLQVIQLARSKFNTIKKSNTWQQKTNFAKTQGYTSIADAISVMGKLHFDFQYKKWLSTNESTTTSRTIRK